jgi:glycosyltransferase involved in cell wall biosynthesis
MDMRIAFIGQKGIPAVNGGVEKHVEELAVHLVRKGHQVTVYTRPNYVDKNKKNFKGVELLSLPSIPTKNLDAISHTFLASIHSLFGSYDIIHYHSIGPSSLSFIPRIFSRGSKVIATHHCQDYFHQKWSLLGRLYLKFGEFMAVKAPHRTIAVSSQIMRYIDGKYGKKLDVIPNGMSVEPTDRFDRLEKWGITPKGYLLTVSRLIRHKGIHHLIAAYKRLKKAGVYRGKKLVIVGDGFHTDDYVGFLKKIAGNDKDIIFTGNLIGEGLRQIFSNAYLFIQPSESEGLSIALLEAMGYGLPVLASDIPENLEAMGGHGFSFKNKHVEDLEKKLQELLVENNSISEIGVQAKDFANEKYNWESITEKTERIYSEALNSVKLTKKDKLFSIEEVR